MQVINCAPNAGLVILAKNYLCLKAKNERLGLEKYHDMADMLENPEFWNNSSREEFP